MLGNCHYTIHQHPPLGNVAQGIACNHLKLRTKLDFASWLVFDCMKVVEGSSLGEQQTPWGRVEEVLLGHLDHQGIEIVLAFVARLAADAPRSC